MTTKETFLEILSKSIGIINFQESISQKVDCIAKTTEIINDVSKHFSMLHHFVESNELSDNYINQFTNEVNQTLNLFPYRNQINLDFILEGHKSSIKLTLESQNTALENQLKLMQFNFDFFSKLGFFQNNVVAVGANGSGKTSLSNELKKYLPQNGVVIAAQKILIVPTFSGISNETTTNQKLAETQSADKTLKTTYSTESNGNAYHIISNLGLEFKVLLDNLLAERSSIRNKFCDAINDGSTNIKVPQTKLDIALNIWNSLIQHRKIECSDGINITLSGNGISSYKAYQMSDGEKVSLYLIAQILQAPKDGFIIVDEPEMYLHKTILHKLWNILEKERQDCIFIYLTHDLDFATSRPTAKKVWIRSFKHPDHWEIENIPENELPEPLLLELLGSRKTILFCEGKKGSIDEKVYNILFPQYTVTPVDNCFAVINYTKAFNKIKSTTVKSVGLIDADHQDDSRLEAIKSESIFSFSMTEIENLFLDENYLKLLAAQLLKEETLIIQIRNDVIDLLEKEKELQISNYVSAKINYYFKDSHVSKGNTLEDVKKHYLTFSDEITIQEWYDKRLAEINEIISTKNYIKTLEVFNNKGLKSIANKYFKISDFTESSIRLLQFNPIAATILLTHFPEELR